jgi:predicted esterase
LENALTTAERILERYPTKRVLVVRFLNELKDDISRDPKYFSLLGYALVAIGNRSLARSNFLEAYRQDSNNEDAISGLARLNALPAGHKPDKKPWPLPFSLSDVFQRPTAAEIRAVEEDWHKRDLSPAGIRDEKRGEITIDGWTANVRIISYLIHGSRNYGAVIIPKNVRAGCCPVIVDAKGVSPTYFPLDLEKIESIRTLDDLKDRFIYVIPSYRGEVLNFDGISYKSEGDRRDALDGATDDTISFLTAAIKITPEIDPKRVCAFGHSRGGTVAMLAGIRDKRIDCVVNVAGPTDWFFAMGTEGWTEKELWQEGVRIHATPLETGGQNLERFMGRAFEGSATLADVRHNMIASSPLYFAKRLPLSQNHYGIEDVSVPVRNGRQLAVILERKPRNNYGAYFYPGEGHDTDRIKEPRLAKAFIAKTFNVR